VVRAAGKGLDEKAMEAVRKYKFKPAMRDGKTPVPVYVNVEVNFRFTEGAPSQQNQAIAQPAAEPVLSNSSSSEPSDPQETLGEDFENGTNGHPKDDAQAVYWYRKAAEHGFAAAQRKLADMYLHGRGGLPQDTTQSIAWWKKGADQGDDQCKLSLAKWCEYRCQSYSEQIEYCKKWAADSKDFCLSCRVSSSGGSEFAAYCPEVLNESHAATREEAEVSNRAIIAQQERQRQFQASQDAASFAKERRAHQERVAADKASAAKHTTRYEGLYVGEFLVNAPFKESGCKEYDAFMYTAMLNIGGAKSITECVLDIKSDGSIGQIMVLTRIPYMQEYNELVRQYGQPLYFQRPLRVDDTMTWQMKDGTEINEVLQSVTAYGQKTVYTMVLYDSR
jgi:hypothetical protein